MMDLAALIAALQSGRGLSDAYGEAYGVAPATQGPMPPATQAPMPPATNQGPPMTGAGGLQAAPSPAAPKGTGDPMPGATGGLGGLGGLPQKNPNEWAPQNATDIMWLRQNNPGQLQTLNQQEMMKPGYDPAKAKWGQYNAGDGFGQAMMDHDMAQLTGIWHSGRS